MDQRRSLDFTDFDAIQADVEKLLNGHRTVGTWTLPEILSHLSKAMRLTMRGAKETPPPPTPEQDEQRKAFFETRQISAGRVLPTALLEPSSDHSAEEAVQTLKDVLERFRKYDGLFNAHPVMGPLTHDEWIQFHCVHCAHHLSFAHPTT